MRHAASMKSLLAPLGGGGVPTTPNIQHLTLLTLLRAALKGMLGGIQQHSRFNTQPFVTLLWGLPAYWHCSEGPRGNRGWQGYGVTF
eukprot:1153321-Pelagomonas_calceolata.AAC.1